MMRSLILCFLPAAMPAGEWTRGVEVRQDSELCVTYRARMAGSYLVIEAVHQKPWHTYSLDNKARAEEKLAGRKALGQDRPTEIQFSEGIEVVGPWYQTTPKDMSKPEIRMFTWGFEERAVFVAEIKPTGKAASIGIKGQACTESSCKNIDIEIPFRAALDKGKLDIDLATLSKVR